MLTFAERLKLARAEEALATMELNAALAERTRRIERGWEALAYVVLNEKELDYR